MNIKITLLNMIVLVSLSACHKETFNDLKINEKYQNETPQIEVQQVIEEDTKTESNPTEETAIITPPQVITQTDLTIETERADEIDDSSLDYQIHKGRIDCLNEKACLERSMPIQFEFKDIITNTFYLEVHAKNDEVLGYFIEYVFRTNTYDTEEECENVGRAIKETLNDRVTAYTCQTNTLSIITDY